MNSTATVAAEPALVRLDLHELRDDLARSYAPANAHERMLVTQIAQSFLRLQKAQNAEAQYFEKKGVYEAITTDFNTYKAITRYTSDCERAWRHAVLMLERTQRRRIKIQRSDRVIVPREYYEETQATPANGSPADAPAESAAANHPRPVHGDSSVAQSVPDATPAPNSSPAPRHSRPVIEITRPKSD